MNKRGFTLIETFGAITILILAVLGPLTLLTSNISAGALIKNQITASYLAQEGVELVINRRDVNADANVQGEANAANITNAWLEGLEDCLSSGSTKLCSLQIPVGGGDIVASGCKSFEQDEAGYEDDSCNMAIDNDRYVSYSSGLDQTYFRREISIQPFSSVDPQDFGGTKYFEANEGAKVTVTVWWKFKSEEFNKKSILTTVIYNPSVSITTSEEF